MAWVTDWPADDSSVQDETALPLAKALSDEARSHKDAPETGGLEDVLSFPLIDEDWKGLGDIDSDAIPIQCDLLTEM